MAVIARDRSLAAHIAACVAHHGRLPRLTAMRMFASLDLGGEAQALVSGSARRTDCAKHRGTRAPGQAQRAPPQIARRSATLTAGRAFAAVDLGAESGRVVLGRLDHGSVSLEVVHRFANRPVASTTACIGTC